MDKSGVELVNISKECLYTGIQQCGPGKPFSGLDSHHFHIDIISGTVILCKREVCGSLF